MTKKNCSRLVIRPRCLFHACVNAVADLEIFRGGFSLTKTPAKLEVKTKKKEKKVITSFLSHFLTSSSKFTL